MNWDQGVPSLTVSGLISSAVDVFLNDSISLSEISLSGGASLTLNGNIEITQFVMNDSTVLSSGNVTFTNFYSTSSILNGAVHVSQIMSLDKFLNCTSSGLITLGPQSVATFGVATFDLYNIDIINYGRMEHSIYILDMRNSIFTNEASGVFYVKNRMADSTFNALALINYGNVTVEVSTQFTSNIGTLTNEGIITCINGKLRMIGSEASHSGSLTFVSSLFMQADFDVTFHNSSLIEGLQLSLDGAATFNFNGDVKIRELRVSSEFFVIFEVPVDLCALEVTNDFSIVVFRNGVTVPEISFSTGFITMTRPKVHRLVSKDNSFLTVSEGGCIDELIIQDTIGATFGGDLKVNSRFELTGTFSLIFGDYTNGNRLSLMPSCTSSIHASQDGITFYLPIYNYGSLQLDLIGSSLLLNNASIYNMEEATFEVNINASSDLYGKFGAFVNYGNVTMQTNDNATVLNLSTNVENYGRWSISGVGGVAMDAFYQASLYPNGRMIFNDAKLDFNVLSVYGGSLEGTGLLNGTIIQSGGVIRPGTEKLEVGKLWVNSLMQFGGRIEIHASSAEVHDQISVVENFTQLSGIIQLLPLWNYTANVGDVIADVILATQMNTTSSYGMTNSNSAAISVVGNKLSLIISSTIKAACSGGCQYGDCVDADVCICSDGYTGSDCSQPDCTGIGGCNNGTCIGANICLCSSSAVGTNCMHPVTTPCDPNYCGFCGDFSYTCLSHPVGFCNGDIAVSYTTKGSCQQGYCSYVPSNVTCSTSIGEECIHGSCITRETGPGPSTQTNDQIINDSKEDRINEGAIIGGVIGGVVGLFLIIAIIALVLFRKKKKATMSQEVNLEAVKASDVNSSAYAPIANRTKNIKESNNNRFVPIVDTEGWQEIPYHELTMKDKIGQGAGGTVFQGEWRGAPVAIKLLRDDANRNQYLSEIAISKTLRPHINVVQFLGICSKDVSKPLCIVTQLCEGGSLYSLLHSSDKIENENLERVIKGIAAGMYHLNSEKIIHRDLAARNILLDSNFNGKVSDFGLSRVAVNQSESETASVVGPLKHMAPESLLYRKYSEKSDVWAFAVTVWEIFARSDPYPDLNPIEVAARVPQTNNPLRLEPTPNMSLDMAELFLACIATNADDRPTFAEIMKRLNKMPLLYTSTTETNENLKE